MRLYAVDFLGEGGITHYNYQLCNALQNHGMEATLLTSERFELHDMPRTFVVKPLFQLWAKFGTSANVKNQNIVTKYGKLLYRLIRRLWRLIKMFVEWCRLTKIVLQGRPDVVQFGTIYTYPFAFIFLWFLKRRGIYLTQICHEFEVREGKGHFLAQLAAKLNSSSYPLFDAIIFHSEYGRQKFLGQYKVSSQKTHVLPMGNESFFESIADNKLNYKEKYNLTNEFVVLFFGRISADKGILDLLEAFSIVSKSTDIPLALIIAGPPVNSFDFEVVRNVKKLKIEDLTILEFGYLPNESVKPLMDIASVAVFPYHTSSQSLSLQMAYTSGKSVIATRVGGLPEAVESEKSGLLVDAHSPTQIAHAIIHLIDNPQMVAEMGTYAKNLSETKHSWHTIASQMAEIYDRIFYEPSR